MNATPVRKQRAKTGCLSCRQRRVKCDERRPNCERCQKANVLCAGYETPRALPLKRSAPSEEPAALERSTSVTSSQHSQYGTNVQKLEKLDVEMRDLDISPSLLSIPTSTGRRTSDQFAAREVSEQEIISDSIAQPLHRRALDALGYQQYTTETVKLLFHPDHQDFWNGTVLTIAWGTEYVFDAVVTLGAIHRALLFLSREKTRQLGAQMQIMAFEAYGVALAQLQKICEEDLVCVARSLRIGVLMLLTYFESFAGNPASAFRHLRTAHYYITEHPEQLAHHEELLACTNELSLVAQIVLPMEHFPLYARKFDPEHGPRFGVRSTGFSSTATDLTLQSLLDFICQYPTINRAVWTPLSATEDAIHADSIMGFQQRLLQLCAHLRSDSSLQQLNGDVARAREEDIGAAFALSSNAGPLGSSGDPVAHMLFCCYMARTYWMLANDSPNGSRLNAHKSRKYAHHIIRIVQSLDPDASSLTSNGLHHTACNAVKMGITPLLYMAAIILNDASTHKWAAARLRLIKREGLYNSEHFAKALDLVDMFQARIQPHPDNASPRPTMLASPILIPDAEERNLAVYYARPIGFAKARSLTPVEVLGCARWTRPEEGTGAAENLTIQFFEKTHALNDGEFERCVYYRISDLEPNVASWRMLFSVPSVARGG